ncbi:arginine--tRNA ligase [Caproicibacterium lactatifermentans]|uniref:arginine--tRNA ligase n=1 Tax=Caproicibacterium lactatifermentans TaxID=2666138 RepID=UPI003D8F13F2
MSKYVQQAKDQLRQEILSATAKAQAAQALPASELPDFTLEVPADRAHGDWAANAAMVSARAFHMAPRKIAEALAANIHLDDTFFSRCEIAGPGFLNFFYRPEFYTEVLRDVAKNGESYGRSSFGGGKRVLVEFVSANPTGPMHIGNARGGAIGDCLASVLDAAGYQVQREFYVNDAGNQVNKFGLSLEARYLQLYKGEDAVPFPEDGYHGADITEHAKNFAKINGDRYVNAPDPERRQALVDYALPLNIQGLQDDLLKYRIRYDNWFRESTLHQSGAVRRVIEQLKEHGATYEKDGALWFKGEPYGSEDFVLVRANGVPTYVVPDIAYHYNKLVTRSFDKAIDVLGADHHGYVPRLKGALQALGVDTSRLDVLLMQMVRLVRDGQVVKASKRSGNAITLVTLLDEVPVDAARFLFNMREPNSEMDFDLGLAVQQDSKNPVYYVQYAYARLCSLFRTMKEEGVELRDCTDEELALLTAPEEIELIHHLSAYTGEIIESAKDYDPARMTRYALTLATLFHKFYSACRIKGEESSLAAARLYLCSCVRTVLHNVLSLLKITAPESM